MNSERAKYTTPEWQTMQYAIIGTAQYFSGLAPHHFESWHEKLIARKTIKQEHNANRTDEFIHELCDYHKLKEVLGKYESYTSSTDIESAVLEAIEESVRIIEEKDPAKKSEYTHLIWHIVSIEIKNINNASTAQKTALQQIASALNDTLPFGDLSELRHPYEDPYSKSL